MISFGQAVKNSIGYIKTNDFKGRSCRSEFWWSYLALLLFYFAAAIVLGIIAFVVMMISESAGLIVSNLLYLALGGASFYISLILTVRRLHDINFRGWWYLLILVPLVGAIAILVMCVLPGTKGPNRFGADPLGGGMNPFAADPQFFNQGAVPPQGMAPQAPAAPVAPQAAAPEAPQNPQNPQQ